MVRFINKNNEDRGLKSFVFFTWKSQYFHFLGDITSSGLVSNSMIDKSHIPAQ